MKFIYATKPVSTKQNQDSATSYPRYKIMRTFSIPFKTIKTLIKYKNELLNNSFL